MARRSRSGGRWSIGVQCRPDAVDADSTPQRARPVRRRIRSGAPRAPLSVRCRTGSRPPSPVRARPVTRATPPRGQGHQPIPGSCPARPQHLGCGQARIGQHRAPQRSPCRALHGDLAASIRPAAINGNLSKTNHCLRCRLGARTRRATANNNAASPGFGQTATTISCREWGRPTTTISPRHGDAERHGLWVQAEHCHRGRCSLGDHYRTVP